MKNIYFLLENLQDMQKAAEAELHHHHRHRKRVDEI